MGFGGLNYPRSVQVLDAPLVIIAYSGWKVGEEVVWGHDGSLRTGVLQAQDVPELMGGNLEKVHACRVEGWRGTPGSNKV